MRTQYAPAHTADASTECLRHGASLVMGHCPKSIALPAAVAPPLAVSSKRGLACVMGERSFLVDIELEADADDAVSE